MFFSSPLTGGTSVQVEQGEDFAASESELPPQDTKSGSVLLMWWGCFCSTVTAYLYPSGRASVQRALPVPSRIKKQVQRRRNHSLVHKETFHSLFLSSEGVILCPCPLEIDCGLCWWLWGMKRIYWLLRSGINLFPYCRAEACSITRDAAGY